MKDLNQITKYIKLILPLFIIYLFSFFCSVPKSSGENIPFRPPGYIFGIAWFILLTLLGLSWYNSLNEILQNTLYLLLIISLCLWIFVYSCKNDKINSVYIILVSLLLSTYIYTLTGLNSKLFIIPLIIWLLFALILNSFDNYK